MNSRQLQIAFTDLLSQEGGPAPIISLKIFRLLTEAQELIIKENYTEFEANQEKTDSLRTLVVKDLEVLTEFGGLPLNGFFIDRITFPLDYWHLLSFRCKNKWNRDGLTYIVEPVSELEHRVSEDPVTDVTVYGAVVQADDVYALLKDPFNTTNVKYPIADINGVKLNVYTNNRFIVDQVVVNYLKRPEPIILDINDADEGGPTLPTELHQDIVIKAVAIHLSRVGLSKTSSPVSQQEG